MSRKSVKGLVVLILLFAGCNIGAVYEAEAAGSDEQPQQDGSFYRTPRAGKALRTEVLGQDIIVHSRDRRSTSVWYAGTAVYDPAPVDADAQFFGNLYFWRHPSEDSLVRAQVALVYNELFWAQPLKGPGNNEWVITWENLTLPVKQTELIDGRPAYAQEMRWGYVRPGAGVGYRRRVPPGYQENMLALDWTFEPACFYFRKGDRAADNFIAPQDTVELRAHLQIRWDGVERNLLELPHQGLAGGGDVLYGYRLNWEDWGLNGAEKAGRTRQPLFLSVYGLAAGGVPGIASERHRLIGSVHGGAGIHIDRFSARRIGGGPNPVGEEYGSTADPVLPGAAMREFFPRHYVIAVGEYRWEPVFFMHLGFTASLAWLDRLRMDGGIVKRENDVFQSAGARLTSGFLYSSRLQLSYNYNFSVIRNGDYGGAEILANITRTF